jgi:hypothetical protein
VGGGLEEFGGGSANFDMLKRGGSFYSFGINGGGIKIISEKITNIIL